MKHLDVDKLKKEWISFNKEMPSKPGFYEWRHFHKKGFFQCFTAEMRMRCIENGSPTKILSPGFDYWDGYKVNVDKGFSWREIDDQQHASWRHSNNVVDIEGINLRLCPFCKEKPLISGSQWGSPAGKNGVVICANPKNYNTWSINQCCRLIGFNGFEHPRYLAEAWNGG